MSWRPFWYQADITWVIWLHVWHNVVLWHFLGSLRLECHRWRRCAVYFREVVVETMWHRLPSELNWKKIKSEGENFQCKVSWTWHLAQEVSLNAGTKCLIIMQVYIRSYRLLAMSEVLSYIYTHLKYLYIVFILFPQYKCFFCLFFFYKPQLCIEIVLVDF